MKVALVYDRVNKIGGAERVLLALHRLFPQAPLYTSVYDPKNAPWAKVFDVKTSYSRIKIVPLYHPAVALYQNSMKAQMFKDFEIISEFTN